MAESGSLREVGGEVSRLPNQEAASLATPLNPHS